MIAVLPCLFAAYACSACVCPLKPGYELVWSDEFDGNRSELHSADWGYETGFLRNHEDQYYTAHRAKNCRVENGCLVIEAHLEDFENAQYDPNAGADDERRSKKTAKYTSASILTKGKRDFGDGIIEVCAKVPPVRGTWPAIWTMGRDSDAVGWPTCGEVDILEYVGAESRTIHCFAHCRSAESALGNEDRRFEGKLFGQMPYEGFHVYALERENGVMTTYYDGKVVMRVDLSTLKPSERMAFDQPHYLRLNLAIGGTWGSEHGIDDTAFPCRMEVDWVRVWRKEK